MPQYLFHRLFRVYARTQGPHDSLLPGGPMSCQSTPGDESIPTMGPKCYPWQ
ncbi:unnamed protein product [Staurois parvus]|uniref:Uncharacterized protein n=1 Tax=Staurois parvus TaxID=386267 RepID=A0ABN9A6P0_9NEOB|nr:unnamed protein product [Staurois parvus]